MSDKRHMRESYFPAIEKKYGKPISYWLTQLKKVKSNKYPDQISLLRENFGFSQAHANALVMYSRGSKSSRRFESTSDYFNNLDPVKAKTMRKIFRVIRAKHPGLKLVISWNQPMLKDGDRYIFGCSEAKNHLLIAPWNPKVIKAVQPLLGELVANKKTIRVPIDWKVNEKLLHRLIKESLSGE